MTKQRLPTSLQPECGPPTAMRGGQHWAGLHKGLGTCQNLMGCIVWMLRPGGGPWRRFWRPRDRG